ncbi:MAG: GYD domain-containing protein [Rhodothermia bacterium]
MPKYLFMDSYTAEGMKGLVSEGGTGRRALIKHLVRELGGELESFYYAFGESDVYAIVDLPDTITVAAVTLAINQTGAASVRTTVLLSAEDVDEAAQMTVGYRAPGA